MANPLVKIVGKIETVLLHPQSISIASFESIFCHFQYLILIPCGKHNL